MLDLKKDIQEFRSSQWNRFLEKVGSSHVSSNLFWKRINNFRNPKTIRKTPSIIYKDSTLTTNQDKAKAFAEILSKSFSSSIEEEAFDNNFKLQVNQCFESLNIDKNKDSKIISNDEIIKAIKILRNRSSPAIQNRAISSIYDLHFDPIKRTYPSIINAKSKSGLSDVCIRIHRSRANNNQPIHSQKIRTTKNKNKEQLIVRLKCTETNDDEMDNDLTINFMEEKEEPINSPILEELRTKITKEAGDVSAKSLRDLTPTNAIEHEIRLTDNIPFNIKPRPANYIIRPVKTKGKRLVVHVNRLKRHYGGGDLQYKTINGTDEVLRQTTHTRAKHRAARAIVDKAKKAMLTQTSPFKRRRRFIDDETFKPTAYTLRTTRPDSRRSQTRTENQRLNYQHPNQ
ncbi:hypothetical protein BpHYR1_002634 [Brachionus plicatilis]|uniref:Uncharacterized protein n=1 Tax=Brachionus plicatilis TaxID=10195 RepID=A0A3M7QQU4_BRAPC|nr:hypothetical protein BpHYR1_002634 [Brachionus plicatilis]